MAKIVFFNYVNKPNESGGMIKTNLSFYELSKLLAGHLFSQQLTSNPKVIAENLPKTKSLDAKKHPELFEFASHLFNNDAASEKVPINKELEFFDTGIRKSHAKYNNQTVYIINLNRIKETHTGTNTEYIVKHTVNTVNKLNNKWHLPFNKNRKN